MRVVIAEDEVLLRQGLELLLSQDGAQVVATAADAPGLLEAARRTRPDVVVSDIRMPPGGQDDGLQAVLRLRHERPELGVMLLSQVVTRRYATELIERDVAGVGYQLKQRVADAAQFCADVRQVAAGGTVLDPEVVRVMVSRARRSHVELDRLTARQREVLALVAEGRTNASIAHRLSITEKSVVQHVSRIYDELGRPPGGDEHRRVVAVLRYLDR